MSYHVSKESYKANHLGATHPPPLLKKGEEFSPVKPANSHESQPFRITLGFLNMTHRILQRSCQEKKLKGTSQGRVVPGHFC